MAGLLYLFERTFSRDLDASLRRASVEELATVGKKVVADAVVMRSENKSRADAVPLPQGYLVAYKQDPEGFKADAKLAETWLHAFLVAQRVLESGPEGKWVRPSDALDFVRPTNRVDAWGNAFCVLRREEVVAVVSAGATAKASPKCLDVRIDESELMLLPRGYLLETPASNYVLIQQRPSREATPAR
ncbi:MAG TPA: hypothetical protein VNK82_01230 [Terriglobales bacterium]|nr:hypothetical protein [Terriglobales bacterium]